MSNVVGYVTKIVETKWNDKILYGITLDGDDRLFGTGTFKPKAEVGQKVSFDVSKNKGRWQADAATVQVLEQAKPVQQFVKSSQKSQGPDYWDRKDRVIERQSCRNSAIALIDVLVSNQAVKLPAAIDKKYDAIVVLVDTLTDRFWEDNARARDNEVTNTASEVTLDNESQDADLEAEADEWLNS